VDAIVAQNPSKGRHVALECAGGRVRWASFPEVLDQAVGGHNPIGVSQQQAKQGAGLASPDGQFLAIGPHRQCSQD
jgi:hypothetical protein